MIALPILSIVCCIAYVAFVTFKFKVPVSISETYYLLDNKWDWLFSAWCVMTSVPFGIWWFTISPKSLCWIPIVVAIAVCMIGVSCRYKSGPKNPDDVVIGSVKSSVKPVGEKLASWNGIKEFFVGVFAKFKPDNFFKYGWARMIHYVNSLIAIILSMVYICIVNPIAIASVVLSFVLFTIVGVNVDGSYNKQYVVDVDHTSWIYFWEVCCFLQLFTFAWTTAL